MSADDFKRFYKGRHKELLIKGEKMPIGTLYRYDDDGNLVTTNKEGAIEQTLVVPAYRPPTLEEVDEMRKQRQEEIAIAMKGYDDAYQKLHDEYERKDRSDQKVIEYGRAVMEADNHLQHVRYPLRYFSSEDGVEIRRLDFNQPNETRKLPYAITTTVVSPFSLQQLYVREGDAPPKEAVKSVAEIRRNETGPVILFQDSNTNEYGFMALDWPVQIKVRSAVYHCAKQALAAELAKIFKDDENYRKIMSAESPSEVSYEKDDVKEATPQEWAEATKKVLYDVQASKFRQFPELQSRLLATQNATLGAYQPNDTVLGIGISMEDIHAKNPLHWTGQNLLGTVLMDIRATLKKELDEQLKEAPKKRLSNKRPIAKQNAPVSSMAPVSMAPVPNPPIASNISMAPIAPVSIVPAPVAPIAPIAPASIPPIAPAANPRRSYKKPEVMI